MSEFYSAYLRPARGAIERTPAGSREVPQYSVRITDNGHKEVYRSGTRDLYEYIQASLEQSKVQNIIRRALGGDPTALAARNGSYLDVTSMPDNMIDLSNLAIKLHFEFDHLPADVRAKFDNSVDQFVALYGTQEWADRLGLVKEKPVVSDPVPADVKKEVTTDGATA